MRNRVWWQSATDLERVTSFFPCFENLTNYLEESRPTRTNVTRGNEGWTAGAIYLFYLGWLWTGIGDLDGLVGRQPPGVPLDVDAGVHSGLLLRLPCPSSFLAASSSRQRFPEVPRVTPGPLLGPRSYTTNPQFLTWNGREGVSVKNSFHLSASRGKGIRDRSHVDEQNVFLLDESCWFLLCFVSSS